MVDYRVQRAIHQATIDADNAIMEAYKQNIEISEDALTFELLKNHSITMKNAQMLARMAMKKGERLKRENG